MTTRLLDPSLFVPVYFFFFFNDTATTEIYTLSLHDALPIFFLLNLLDFHSRRGRAPAHFARAQANAVAHRRAQRRDRKSTRLNSSHGYISYAVFCLKKKNWPAMPARPQPTGTYRSPIYQTAP